MKEKFRNKRREITLIIIFSMVLIFFFSGFSIGKEFSRTNIEGKTEIAEPILKVESDETIEMKHLEDTGIYQFKVKNYDETGKVNQVDLEYYIEILSDIDQNISFKIYKENKELQINENKTEKFLIRKNQEQEDKYKIEITCDKTAAIEEIMQEIQIKVHSEQKKI